MAFLIIVFFFFRFSSSLRTTQPPTKPRVGWTSSPDVRSTADILWSCGAVFLVCTWKCMHFNLPSLEESEAQWHTL
ncbi:hypothetical protein BJX63DRAFT_407174 [Aspergillus granulosus]|uniref:Secreted protein n=1 Tax=Aspergillus granulosus TaxID=176169 RepID=A0ABR4H0W6_9EURO